MERCDNDITDRAGPGNETPPVRIEDDYFITQGGETFAGRHLIVDLWGAKGLGDTKVIEHALRRAAGAAGATLLHIHLHRFTDSGGISGVAVLAESHISIHTWPERGFVALDVFMCGDTTPHDAIAIFMDAFSSDDIEVRELHRGQRR